MPDKRPYTWQQWLRSWFRPLVLAKRSSQLNPLLQVVLHNGRLRLDTAHANYSHGALHDLFAEVWAEQGIADWPLRRALLLGYGAGSVAQLLRASHPHAHLTAVEADAAVLELARTWWPSILNSDRVQIIHADAVEYVSTSNECFDLVIVDVYIDRDVPSEITDLPMLQRLWACLAPGGRLLFNWISDTQHLQQAGQALSGQFERLGATVQAHRTATNTVLVVRNPQT